MEPRDGITPESVKQYIDSNNLGQLRDQPWRKLWSFLAAAGALQGVRVPPYHGPIPLGVPLAQMLMSATLTEHVEIAYRLGILPQVDFYLRSLPAEAWTGTDGASARTSPDPQRQWPMRRRLFSSSVADLLANQTGWSPDDPEFRDHETEILATALTADLERLGQLGYAEPLVSRWCETIRREICGQLMLGMPVPGWKLVRTAASSTQWKDENEARRVLAGFVHLRNNTVPTVREALIRFQRIAHVGQALESLVDWGPNDFRAVPAHDWRAAATPPATANQDPSPRNPRWEKVRDSLLRAKGQEFGRLAELLTAPEDAELDDEMQVSRELDVSDALRSMSGVRLPDGLKVVAKYTGDFHEGTTELIAKLDGTKVNWARASVFDNSVDGAVTAFFVEHILPTFGRYWHSLYDFDYSIFVTGAQLVAWESKHRIQAPAMIGVCTPKRDPGLRIRASDGGFEAVAIGAGLTTPLTEFSVRMQDGRIVDSSRKVVIRGNDNVLY